VFVYRAHVDAAMDVDSTLEPWLRNAMMVIGRAMGWRIAARCDRGHDYANGVEGDQGKRTVRAHSGNKPAQHAALTLRIDPILRGVP
jgi:hypothetical protein